MTTNKLALVTGVTGQDGSYLAELLLLKNYTVIGLKRRSSTNNNYRIEHILDDPNFTLEEFDLTDPTNVIKTIDKYQPEEFYNLAAQSHVKTSFSQPTTTICINTLGVINILEAIKTYSSTTKFYQASTSEMFGMNYDVDDSGDKYQDENTNMLPQSPYGIAKLYGFHMTKNFRESFDMFACNGILFNHESPIRGLQFVTRKVTFGVANILSGNLKTITLNIDEEVGFKILNIKNILNLKKLHIINLDKEGVYGRSGFIKLINKMRSHLCK